MKTVIPVFLLLALAGAAQAQTPAQTHVATPPTPAAANLTRDLNSGPPRPANHIVTAPAPAAPMTSTPVATVPPQPAAPQIVKLAPVATAVPRPVEPPVAAPRSVAPIPTTPAPAPTTAPIGPANPASPLRTQPPAVPTSPATAAPAAPVPTPAVTSAARSTPAPPVATTPPVPAATPTAEASPPPAPAYTVLDAAALAALPFTVELPAGFSITTGRPGTDFRIYTIRRGDRSFAMVYAGPASQFPIYGGQMVQAGGRATVISTEDGQRHLMEHLFQRADAPREVHIWTMTLEGADRTLAERIAQSLDMR